MVRFICAMHSLFLYRNGKCVRKILFCKNLELLCLCVYIHVYVYMNECNVRMCVECSVWVCLFVCLFICLILLYVVYGFLRKNFYFSSSVSVNNFDIS
jgi:hypothetical protein